MRLHHVADGPVDAPPLVLSNSLGTTLEMWEPQLEALSRRFRVVRYDARGHGRSSVASEPTRIDDLGRDVVELMDELGLERVSFCGLSIGGVVGMWLAANAPERVRRLVLCCTRPSFAPRETWLERATIVRAQGLEAIADAVIDRWFRPAFRRARPEVVARFRGMLVSTPADGYAACCDALADADLTPFLGTIAVPTLVITGAADPVAPPSSGEALAAALPVASHTSIADAAHIANAEQPDDFTAALLQHIDRDEETR
jgi:3-oxoadipate enol-lactonase